MWSELESIWEEIQQYLWKSSLITMNVLENFFDLIINDEFRFDVFLIGEITQGFYGMLYGLGEVEEFIVELELHLFQLCKVHQIIDQIEKHRWAILTVFEEINWIDEYFLILFETLILKFLFFLHFFHLNFQDIDLSLKLYYLLRIFLDGLFLILLH